MLDELLTIIANNETKNDINITINKMPHLVVDKLSRKMCHGKKIVVTPYYIQMFIEGVEDLSLNRPDCSEKILLRVLMWFDGVEVFSSQKEAYDWLVGYGFSSVQLGWISPHIIEYVVNDRN